MTSKKDYVLNEYRLFNIEPGNFDRNLSLGERWWNGISTDVALLREESIKYCRNCEADTEKYRKAVQSGKDVTKFERKELSCSRDCFWYKYFKARRI